MRTLFGISTIFLMVGLLVAPGCAFAAEFSTSDNFASDFKLSASSEKISPEVKGGGGSRGGSSSSSSSKAVKKADGDDDDGTDDGSDSGFPWWIIILIIVIILLAVAAVVWFVFLKK